jgi:hypothetical protein
MKHRNVIIINKRDAGQQFHVMNTESDLIQSSGEIGSLLNRQMQQNANFLIAKKLVSYLISYTKSNINKSHSIAQRALDCVCVCELNSDICPLLMVQKILYIIISSCWLGWVS